MKINELIEKFKTERVQNTKVNPNAVSEWIREEIKIKTYIPFRQKREIVEMVVGQNIETVDGIKKYDSINAYVGFVVAMISAHTDLVWSPDPVADYDLLAESGLLPQIITEFQESYNECDVIMKMVLAMELEDNNVNVLIGHFLDDILKRLSSVGEKFKGTLGDFNIQDILGGNIKEEDLTKLSGLIDKLK